MTYATAMQQDLPAYDPDRSWRQVSTGTLGGAVVLASSIWLGAVLLDNQAAHSPNAEQARAVPTPASKLVAIAAPTAPVPAKGMLGLRARAGFHIASAIDQVPTAGPQPMIAVKPEVALLHPALTAGIPSGSFGRDALLGRDFAPSPAESAKNVAQRTDIAPAPPVVVAQMHDAAPAGPANVSTQAHDTAPALVATGSEPVISAPAGSPTSPASQVADNVPVPLPRPTEFRLQPGPNPIRTFGRRFAQIPLNRPTQVASAPADNRNFIEKLFGMPQQPPGPALGYASPEDGVVRRLQGFSSGPAVASDRQTAIYDISAHTVYMPNGTTLEAHSGLGPRLDDPRSVNLRDRGATPPAVYELQPREALFHGVQALRLNPVGGGSTYGRTGLLAHTYMLGPNGDSNGCVSFRNYEQFLQAYQNGEVRRLLVVARRT